MYRHPYLPAFVFAFLAGGVFAPSAAAQSANLTTAAPSAATPTSPAPVAPAVLNEVVVVGQLDRLRDQIMPSLGATEYSFSRGQVEAQSQGVNALFNEVLLRAPGVAADSYGQVHVRGEHANLQYRINDVLLPEGVAGFGQELDTRFIESVNLITGALPAQYGDRTAGIVDIHTRSGAFENGGDVSMYGGSFGTYRPSFEAGGHTADSNYYVTGTYDQNNLGVENPTPSYNAIHDSTEQYKTFGYFSRVLDATSRVSLMLSGSDSHFQIPNTAGLPPAFKLAGVPSFNSAQLNENQYERNSYLILAYQKSAGDLDYQLSAFTRYSDTDFHPDANGDLIFNGVGSWVDRSLFSNGFEADFSDDIADRHTLRFGALVLVEAAAADTNTLVFPANFAGAQTSTVPLAIEDNNHLTGYLGGAYLQDEWKITDRLTLNYGARFDYLSTYLNSNQVSPRINAVYQADAATTLHAGYARYFTPPPLELVNQSSVANFAGTTNQAAVTTASPVQPERANYFDAGVTRQISKHLQVGLDGYYKYATNELDEGQFGTALIFAPFNYRVGEIYGLELTSSYNDGGFSAYTNLALSRARGKDVVSGQFQFDPAELAYIQNHWVYLDHDQRVTLSTGTSYKIGRWLAYADLLFGSGLRDGFANNGEVAPYYTVNTGFSRKFTVPGVGELTARFDVVNVFDQVYQLRDGSGIGVGAPQHGERRGFFGGVSVAF